MPVEQESQAPAEYVHYKASRAHREWLGALAARVRRTKASVIEEALEDYAAKHGAPPPPPRVSIQRRR